MTTPRFFCARCKRVISEDEARPVHAVFKYLASFSLAPVHAGQWVWKTFSENYCASCRIRLSVISVVVATVVLSLAAYGFHWAIGQGLFSIGK